MKPKITVIGSANIDYVMRVPLLPKVGETVTGGEFFQAFGGKGANQAVAAARAGAEVRFIGALGNDPTARSYKESLKSDQIDCSELRLEAGTASGSALIMFNPNGDNFIGVAPGANDHVSPERIQALRPVIAESDWIILQMEIPTATNQEILKLAAELEIPVLLNYAPANDLSLELSAAVHGLVVNEHEAAELLGQSFDPADTTASEQAARKLREQGRHRFVVITLGAYGLCLVDDSGAKLLPAFEVQATDTTAAGDTFCGALTVALAQDLAHLKAAQFASAASALSVTKAGAQPSIPTRSAIDDFQKKAVSNNA